MDSLMYSKSDIFVDFQEDMNYVLNINYLLNSSNNNKINPENNSSIIHDDKSIIENNNLHFFTCEIPARSFQDVGNYLYINSLSNDNNNETNIDKNINTDKI